MSDRPDTSDSPGSSPQEPGEAHSDADGSARSRAEPGSPRSTGGTRETVRREAPPPAETVAIDLDGQGSTFFSSGQIERLGDFRIVREIGRGGMGIVYEAEQESLGRRVAVKVLPRQMLLDEQHVERFKREAKVAAGLHHTNIVQIFGVGEDGGYHYYVMQLIQGVGLDRIIKRLGSSPAAGTPPAVDASSSATEFLCQRLLRDRASDPTGGPSATSVSAAFGATPQPGGAGPRPLPPAGPSRVQGIRTGRCRCRAGPACRGWSRSSSCRRWCRARPAGPGWVWARPTRGLPDSSTG